MGIDISDVHVDKPLGSTSFAYRENDQEGVFVSPMPNFHSARVKDPGEFQEGTFRTKELPMSEGGKGGVELVLGRLKGEDTITVQAYRFPKDKYTPEEVRAWLKENKIENYKLEPAKDEVEKAVKFTEREWDGSASRFDDEQWKASCLVDQNTGDKWARALCKLPIKEPDGTVNVNAVRNALARLSQTEGKFDREAIRTKLEGFLEQYKKSQGVEKGEQHSREYLDKFHETVMGHKLIPTMIKEQIHRVARGAASGKLKGSKVPEEQAAEAATNAEKPVKKCEGAACKVQKQVPIVKLDGEQKKVWCVVASPGEFDLQGDRMNATEIEKAAHRFLERLQREKIPGVGVDHNKPIPAYVIENTITKLDGERLGDQVLQKGTWYQAYKVDDEAIWARIKSGDITGVSVQGRGIRTPAS